MSVHVCMLWDPRLPWRPEKFIFMKVMTRLWRIRVWNCANYYVMGLFFLQLYYKRNTDGPSPEWAKLCWLHPEPGAIMSYWIISSVVHCWNWSEGAEHVDSWFFGICCSNILAAGKNESAAVGSSIFDHFQKRGTAVSSLNDLCTCSN